MKEKGSVLMDWGMQLKSLVGVDGGTTRWVAGSSLAVPECQPEKLGLGLKGSGEPWEGCE